MGVRRTVHGTHSRTYDIQVGTHRGEWSELMKPANANLLTPPKRRS